MKNEEWIRGSNLLFVPKRCLGTNLKHKTKNLKHKT